MSKNTYLQTIREDLLAYTDDPESVNIGPDGYALYSQLGYLKEAQFSFTRDGAILVEVNGQKITYDSFITKELAKLDVLANRILANKKSKNIYVDSNAILKTFDNATGEESKATALLAKECENTILSTKLTFITADAGHGKSSLLREFQTEQARKYIKGDSNYLFWHIDLQGRQLSKLDEAIMLDLSNLRISGLFLSSIYNLIKKNKLIIAIDGFDELAVEQGASDSIGALGNLLSNLDENGIIIAASRRAFFNHDDYVKKFNSINTFNVIYNELSLQNWSKIQNIEYSDWCIDSDKYTMTSNEVYDEMVNVLHSDTHPFLTKPFLFTKIIEGLLESKQKPTDFIGNSSNLELEGIGRIVTQFIKREVSEKWKFAQTNEPYLSETQHIEFLSQIASEMWDAQKDYLSSENIQIIAKLLCDSEWKITDNRKQVQIADMAKQHALLIPQTINNLQYLKFEHQEFKNYFLAIFLSNLFTDVINGKSSMNPVKRILSHSQMSDSVALYVSNHLKTKLIAPNFLDILEKALKEEWRASYLQINAGTFVPFIINGFVFPESGYCFGKSLDSVSNKVTYASIIFEDKKIAKFSIENANFINISFRGTRLESCGFKNCEFNEIKFYNNTENYFNNVQIDGCNISSVHVVDDLTKEIVDIYYSPSEIQNYLSDVGFVFIKPADELPFPAPVKIDSSIKKIVRRFLYSYYRTTLLPEYSINPNLGNLRSKFSQADFNIIDEHLIPLLLKFNILKQLDKERDGRVWQLLASVEDLLSSENSTRNTKYSEMWNEIEKLA